MTQGPPLKNKQMKKRGEVSSLGQPREILGKRHVCLKPALGTWAPRPAHPVARRVSASAHLRRAPLGAHANFASQRDRAHRHPRRTSPKLRTMRGDRPGLWLLWLLTVGVVQGVLGDSAITTTVHNGQCPPGSHFSDLSGGCSPCTGGVDYMSVSNNQLSCFPCQVCKSDEVLLSDCTETKDTECRCKPGTFRDKSHSTEICEKCSSLECPAGMVMKTPCTSLSDIKCVPEESGDGVSVILPVVAPVISGVVVIIAIMCCCIRIRSGLTTIVNKVCCWGVLQGPGAEDNFLNRILNCREYLGIRVPEQEQAELESVTVTSPGETECMLEQAGGEESQRTGLLPAANGSANPIDDTGAPGP